MTGLTEQSATAGGTRTRVAVDRGREGVVDVDLDGIELNRRDHLGSRPILNLDLLNVLLTMPAGEAIPSGRFSTYEWQKLLAGSHIGAVELGSVGGRDFATRLARPPLFVRHAMVEARQWRLGVRAASRYAPYCSRAVVLDRLPADDLELLLEAGYLGIGLHVRDGDGELSGGRCVVDAAPFAPARYTGASWLFAERLLKHLLDDAG